MGPRGGMIPKRTKYIMVVRPTIVERIKACFNQLGLQITTGTRQLGGYIGSETDKTSHVRAKVGKWTLGITYLASVN